MNAYALGTSKLSLSKSFLYSINLIAQYTYNTDQQND